ncbi:hypothetical protein [Spirosoma fluviale]|uniref:Uncharacterized protein n=1 Tax=Spirosoma fluviale TaxID=1597977 RepID=A0A286FB79_9BACT|nr:hypothetical protein [Spirosoma fluviale]SOD80485.1 hypothetical protein SAMN06269250_1426 [Spirosoma fluviale]
MTIELYKALNANNPTEHPDSPVSNIAGELPDDEPSLDFGDLLGTFSSREDAIAYINQQVADQGLAVLDTQSSPYNEYTHVEWLTVIVEQKDQSTQNESYYLVTDEGY